MPQTAEQHEVSPEVSDWLRSCQDRVVQRLEAHGQREGKLYYVDRWLTPNEVRSAHRRLGLKRWLILVELCFVFALILGSAWLLNQILIALAGA